VGAGVVLAASYEAKACGVQTAMGGAQARRLCPQAVVVPPRMSAYAEASRAVFQVFEDTSPLVEGLSIDEAFIDARGLERISGAPVEIAARLRREIREGVGLPISVGVARTKFLAKVASGAAKPDGLLMVPPDGELAFLHPLPVERLWGVGAVTARKLRDAGIATVGEVARHAEADLVSLLGRAAGRHLHALAHNRDPRLVRVGRRRRSIGAQHALGRSPRSWDALEADLWRWSTASRAGCGQPGGYVARSCSGSASATSRERPGRARFRRRPHRRRRSSPRRESCSPRPPR